MRAHGARADRELLRHELVARAQAHQRRTSFSRSVSRPVDQRGRRLGAGSASRLAQQGVDDVGIVATGRASSMQQSTRRPPAEGIRQGRATRSAASAAATARMRPSIGMCPPSPRGSSRIRLAARTCTTPRPLRARASRSGAPRVRSSRAPGARAPMPTAGNLPGVFQIMLGTDARPMPWMSAARYTLCWRWSSRPSACAVFLRRFGDAPRMARHPRQLEVDDVRQDVQ